MDININLNTNLKKYKIDMILLSIISIGTFLRIYKIHSQAKLVCVLQGEILDVVVDIRHNCSTFGQDVSVLTLQKKYSKSII